MNNCSYFIEKKALFGSFPTQESVNELEANGVRYFVNLTYDTEKKIIPYTTKYTYLTFPIKDRRYPYNWYEFARFIIKISNIIKSLKNNEKLYINCRAGHGRSGLVVSSILCYMSGFSIEDSLNLTSFYHNNRPIMKLKWRCIGSPQTRAQKNFIFKFFTPLYFYRAYKIGYTVGFSTFSLHPVTIPGIGKFPTAESAYQALKNPDDEIYIKKQMESRTPSISRRLGNICNIRPDWNHVKADIIEMIIRLKIEQHPDIRRNLLCTGFRPLIMNNRVDSFLGIGDGTGYNMIGKILMKIRQEFYECEEALNLNVDINSFYKMPDFFMEECEEI